MNKDLFTVVIPTFNRGYIVGNAIESVQKQTYRNLEILVIDDGSTDNTRDVVKKYVREDCRVRYYYQDNKGQCSARNNGLSLASGEYIYFLDSDDRCLPTFIEKAHYSFCKNKDVGVVYCQTGINKNDSIVPERNDFLEGSIYREALIQGYIAGPLSVIMKTACVKKVGGWDESFDICDDDDIMFRLARITQFKLIDEVLSVAGTDGNDHVTSIKINIAEGWWKLWNKFENDVLALCEVDALIRHYNEVLRKFWAAGDYNVDNKVRKKLSNLNGSIVDLEEDEKYDEAINKIISEGKINYDVGIFPFGEIGKLTKGILNYKYGINEKYRFDSYSIDKSLGVIPISEFAADISNTILIIATSKTHLQKKLMNIAVNYFENDNIYTIF